jgi:hypothetical protein
VERNDFRVRNLAAGPHGAEGRETLHDGIRQLVACDFDNDALKLVRRNVSVPVLVKVVERLAQTLALVAFYELGKLVVYIQLDPAAVTYRQERGCRPAVRRRASSMAHQSRTLTVSCVFV